jgi:hypothetical protein
MSMLDRRLQVLIDDDRWSRLDHEAERRGVPIAVLVREAIDERYPGDADERRAALESVLDADPCRFLIPMNCETNSTPSAVVA